MYFYLFTKHTNIKLDDTQFFYTDKQAVIHFFYRIRCMIFAAY